MGKAVVGIGVAIPVIIIAIIALNFFAVSNLQFRGHSVDDFDFVDLSMDTKFEVCNPTFFPASFDQVSVDIVYKSTNFGTVTIWGQTIHPNSPTVVDGRINLDGQSLLQLFVAAFGSAFGGEEMDFDPNQMRFIAKLDAPLLGFIPFSVSEEYTTDEFTNMMQGQSGQWSCGGEPPKNFMGDNSFFPGLEQTPKPSTNVETPPIGPPGTGQLGGAHVHAAILVKIFGDKFDFSAPAYQLKSSWINFEGNDGNTIHRHASGVTLGYLFETLGLGLDDKCYNFQDGRSFCSNDDYSLKFFINGDQVSDIRDYTIRENDRILISYGPEDWNEILAQLEELDSQTILK
jgi:hypothetical protein